MMPFMNHSQPFTSERPKTNITRGFNQKYFDYFASKTDKYPEFRMIIDFFYRERAPDDPIVYQSLINFLSFRQPLPTPPSGEETSSGTMQSKTISEVKTKAEKGEEEEEGDERPSVTSAKNGNKKHQQKNRRQQQKSARRLEQERKEMEQERELEKVMKEESWKKKPENMDRLQKKDFTLITNKEIEIMNWFSMDLHWPKMTDVEKDQCFKFLSGLANQALVIRACGSEIKNVEQFADEMGEEMERNRKPGEPAPPMANIVKSAVFKTLQKKDFLKSLLKGSFSPEAFRQKAETCSMMGMDMSMFTKMMAMRDKMEAEAEASMQPEGDDDEDDGLQGDDDGEGDEDDEGDENAERDEGDEDGEDFADWGFGGDDDDEEAQEGDEEGDEPDGEDEAEGDDANGENAEEEEGSPTENDRQNVTSLVDDIVGSLVIEEDQGERDTHAKGDDNRSKHEREKGSKSNKNQQTKEQQKHASTNLANTDKSSTEKIGKTKASQATQLKAAPLDGLPPLPED